MEVREMEGRDCESEVANIHIILTDAEEHRRQDSRSSHPVLKGARMTSVGLIIHSCTPSFLPSFIR